ncbi:MAG TPA: hypothetical protein PLD88_13150, partial [Candidatus Berkiella sp.]|nr:hypothetical protein [Candidatus Berkiella sp.]
KELQVAENQRRAEEALKKKTSAIPTIIGAVADNENKNDANSLENALKNQQQGTQNKLQFGQAEEGGLTSANFGKSQREREREEQEARLKEQRDRVERMRLEKERKDALDRQRRQAEAEQKNYDAAVQKTSQQMKSYAQNAYNEWNRVTPQAFVQGELASKPVTAAASGITANIPANKGGQGQSQDSISTTKTIGNKNVGFVKKRKEVIKAGTVLYGVLDTAVNSDEKGPVLATIVSGKYQGGRLVGAFTHQDQQETVIIQFSTMSLPKRTKSLAVQAV